MNPSTDTDPAPICGCLPALPHGVEAVIFDFDGTLANTTESHERALRAALQHHGVELDRRWYRDHVGLSIHDLLAALPSAAALPHAQIIGHSRTRLLADMHTITPIPCVVELLRTARRAGLACAVASNASAVLVNPGIEALGLATEFAAVVSRGDVVHGKPAPDLFLEAARRLGVAPRACLAVEDAPDGLASARAAEMTAIAVIDAHLAHLDTSPVSTETAPLRNGSSPSDRGA